MARTPVAALSLTRQLQVVASKAKLLHIKPQRPTSILSGFWGYGTPASVTPPEALQIPEHRNAFGVRWTDEYSWMERGGEAFELHCQTEQKYFLSSVAPVRRLQRLLHKEFLWQLPHEQESHHEKIGSFVYFTRQTAEQPMTCFVRRPVEGHGEQTILDLNELSLSVGAEVAVGQVKLSKSQHLVAYTFCSRQGQDVYTAIITDLQEGKEIDKLDDVASSIEWMADGSTLLYLLPDEHGRPYKIMRHAIGTPMKQDACIMTEENPECYVALTRTKDWRFVCLNSNSKTSSQVHLLDASIPDAQPVLVEKRRSGVEYYVEHHQGLLYILTNAFGGANYNLVSAPSDTPGLSAWMPVLPPRPGIAIEDVDMFNGYAVLWERHDGSPGLSILQLPASGETANHSLVTQTPALSFAVGGKYTHIAPGANSDFEADDLILHVSSPVLPSKLIHLPVRVGAPCGGALSSNTPWITPLHTNPLAESHALKQDSSFRTWEEQATSPDGTHIPITLSSMASCSAPANCLLVVYGAYGIPLEANFQPERLSLLTRGWIVALAHSVYNGGIAAGNGAIMTSGVAMKVRGGGELSRQWHHMGRQEGKLLAIQDLEACVDHLVDQRFTAHGRIALQASSAGGILAGNVLTKRPASFGAAVLRLPFLDVFTAMTDPSLPLSRHEMDEWGNPEMEGGMELLRSICPYQRLLDHSFQADTAFPPVLLSCALQDERVPACGVAKYAARLRAKLGRKSLVLLQVNPLSGHFADESDLLEQTALEYAFLIRTFER